VTAAGATQLSQPAELVEDKATRIVEAMRVSVAARGIAGSTFDQVARAAGVSRGLLHYYFGSGVRLLVEVVRRECEDRNLRLEQAIAGAQSGEEVLAALVQSFESLLSDGPATPVMFHEMLSLAQRNTEIAAELRQLGRRTRGALADALRAKSEAGVLALGDDPETVAAFLFVLADGILVRRLSEPEFDISPLMDHAVAAARVLLG
jgi:AcrR family transcriptional regulator